MKNSTLRQYPLLAAPVLIELSSIVFLFEPLAIELMEGSAKNMKLSCLYREALIDNLPFVLEARFRKVDTNLNYMATVRNKPYTYRPVLEQQYCYICTPGPSCMVDEFGKKGKGIYKTKPCEIAYLGYLRHLVENMFPIDVMNKTCGLKLGNSKGNCAISSRKVLLRFLMHNFFCR